MGIQSFCKSEFVNKKMKILCNNPKGGEYCILHLLFTVEL